MERVIVTTSIHAPTEAIKLFDALPDWKLIVVGDKRTPPYKLKRGTYVSPEEQESYDRYLSDAIGWNAIQRRNIGLLIAYDLGAEVVALVDDDNIPYPHWGQNLLVGKETEVAWYGMPLAVFDPFLATNYRHLWHRGFPVELLSQRPFASISQATMRFSIQADFWNGDPDVDAFCRMEHSPRCNFHEKHFPFASNKPSPFDSQNTFLLREVLPHYFLFPGIGRMDDIWASYYVQAKGFKVVYGKPSVRQERNGHNLLKDLEDEWLGYKYNLRLIEQMRHSPEAIEFFLPPHSWSAFNLYRRHFG